MSTMPAARSTCSPARRTCATARRSARQIGEIPEGLYPGDYLKPVGEALAAEYGDRLRRRARERMAGAVPHAGGRGDDRADPGRPRPARHPPRPVRVGGRGAGSGPADQALATAARAAAWSTRACSSAPKGKTRTRIGSRSSCTLFRSTQFGDDQDRPIRKSDGSWTYFGADTRLSHAEGARTPTS